MEMDTDSRGLQTTPVPREKVERWMQSGDINVQGAVYNFILEEKCLSRVQPPLEFEDYNQYILNFYERCIIENPDTEWVLSRYIAGYEFVNYFKWAWNIPELNRKVLEGFKKWLGDLYKRGNEEVRICIITSIIEHLFENKNISKFFNNWKEDLILQTAYSEGMVWVEGWKEIKEKTLAGAIENKNEGNKKRAIATLDEFIKKCPVKSYKKDAQTLKVEIMKGK